MKYNKKGILLEEQRFCINDGPGIRTTFFLKGCPLNCMWCHNPDSMNVKKELMLKVNLCKSCGLCMNECKAGVHSFTAKGIHQIAYEKCTYCNECIGVCAMQALSVRGKEISVYDIVEKSLRDLGYYNESGGGVTFSGGEATLQSEFLLECISALHEEQIKSYVDTCGYTNMEEFKKIVSVADGVLFDLKMIEDSKHKLYTGKSNEKILLNYALACSIDKLEVITRIPIIPSINDSEEDIEKFINFISNYRRKTRVELLPYHNYGVSKYKGLGRDYRLPDIVVPTNEQMKQIEKKFIDVGINTIVR